MATITIFLDEARAEDLPPLCLVCGEAADLHLDRTFTRRPLWIGVFGYFGVIGAMLLRDLLDSTARRARVQVPLCRRHNSHWAWRTLLAIAASAWAVVAALLSQAIIGRFDSTDPIRDAIVVSNWVGLAAWLALMIGLYRTAIRATDVTDRSIRLTRVHESFAEALREMAEAMRVRHAEDVRRRWREGTRPG